MPTFPPRLELWFFAVFESMRPNRRGIFPSRGLVPVYKEEGGSLYTDGGPPPQRHERH